MTMTTIKPPKKKKTKASIFQAKLAAKLAEGRKKKLFVEKCKNMADIRPETMQVKCPDTLSKEMISHLADKMLDELI